MTSVWDISEPERAAGFTYSARWSTLRGMGFGQREPLLVGKARISLPQSVNFEALDAAVAGLIPETVPDDLGGETDEVRLARRAMFWAGALQRHYYVPVFGRGHAARSPQNGDAGGAIRLAMPYFAPQAAQAALAWVAQAINSFLATGGLDAPTAEQARKNWSVAVDAIQAHRPPGVNSFRQLRAASLLNIPFQQFLPGNFSFGQGARMRWLQSSYTDRTGMLASRYAGNKMLTAHILRRAGLPTPTHVQVQSADDAVKAARRFGYPVVVKPADRQQGKGVAADLNSDSAVAAAYQNAAKISKIILVEKHFEGADYRMTVLNGELFGVTERVAGGVIGDGTNSVAELVELAKLDGTRARRARERQRELLELDEEALVLLGEHGLTPDSIPEKDAYVRLRRRANSSAGGSQRAVKRETVHPDNLRLPLRAAEILRLDLAGADILFPDITRSWLETGALICEVNGQPQIGTRNTGKLLTMLLGGDGRIPVVIVAGSDTRIDWAALQETLPQPDKVGLATVEGLRLGAERLSTAQASGFEAAQKLLNNPGVEAALIVMPPEEIRRFGLPVDLCDALVLDAPDNWPAAQREAVRDILEIAGPSARRTVYTPPAGLAVLHGTDITVEPAEGDLAEICRAFLCPAPPAGQAETPPEDSGMLLEAL